MYERYYGLRELPFELTPNPKYLCLTAGHREALSNLKYGLRSSKAVTLLLGQAGTGKTTLLQTALASDECRRVRCVCLNNPALTRNEFVQTLAERFNLSGEAARSKAVLLAQLERVLRSRRNRGEITALVIDEAQSLATDLLEEVRLLANLETATEKLLPLVLAGQPELGARLEDPGFQQLKQRVALRCEIAPFDLPETAAYIDTRVATAGGDAAKLFSREAVTLVHEYSHGIPRTINVMCDNALVTAMAKGRHSVEQETVLEVCGDFRLHRDAHALRPVAAVVPEAAPQAVAVEETPQPEEQAPPTRELFRLVTRPRRFGVFG
jgi:type II secretory pathway predicted ATPase ExeA